MSYFSFRENHLLNILQHFDAAKGPLDLFLSNYFRANKAIGAKDRKEISEGIYGIIRWKGLLEHLCPQKSNWQELYKIYRSIDPKDCLNNSQIPLNVRVSFPKSYFQILSDAFGEDRAAQFCINSNQPAPTTIRVNPLKITREELLAKWATLYDISPSIHSPLGITFHKKINFFGLPEFKAGFFEVQDEGSQLVAELVEATPQCRVLDFCAGSGGKTLAFAPKMQHRGQIYLHDIREQALVEAKKRLNRAGIQNAQIFLPHDRRKHHLLKGTLDWVLVDVPCSGSGTLRRNPDMKWKFEPSQIDRLIQEQRQIFETALSFLNPQGSIVYATCSVLPQENEEQIEYFIKKYHLQSTRPYFSSIPAPNSMDGFFGAVLKRS